MSMIKNVLPSCYFEMKIVFREIYVIIDIENCLSKGLLNNYVDNMRGGGRSQKIYVFVHAQGIKTVHARGSTMAKLCPRSC